MKKKAISLLLCTAIVFLHGCSRPAAPEPSSSGESKKAQTQQYTRLPGRLQKREAVYATLEPNGSVRRIDVTDRLISDTPEVRVNDVSSLRDIRAVTTEQMPQTDGLNLTWQLETTQLYYSGTTDKSLPVDLQIRYFLNGKETEQQAMRGKSGEVRIEVRAENRTGTGASITPFLLAGGLLLPKDAEQVQTENGGSFGDGTREIAFGVLLPGMGDALGVDALRERIPIHFSVSFQTKRYSPDSLYFVLVPFNTERLGELLGDALGGETFSIPDLTPLIQQLQDTVSGDMLQSVLTGLPNSTALFRAAGDAMQAYERQTPLLRVLEKYLTEENAEMLRQSIDALSGVSLSKYAELIQDPVFISFVADLGVVSDAFLRLVPTLTAFIADLRVPEVLDALQTLPDTLDKLSVLTAALEENRSGLQTLSDLSANGAFSRLAGLTHSLQSMVDSGTLDALQSMADQADALQSRLRSLLEAGKKYGIFTLAPENAECSVYFVLKTQVR